MRSGRRSVGITEPTVAPLPRWASGIRATCGHTNGIAAERSACSRVLSSNTDAHLIRRGARCIGMTMILLLEVSGRPLAGVRSASARQESNLRPRLRRPVSYPLDHERRSASARRRDLVGLSSGQSQRVCRYRRTTKSGRSWERPPRRRRSRCNTSAMVTAAPQAVKAIFGCRPSPAGWVSTLESTRRAEHLACRLRRVCGALPR
jgi:hypothetical protein